MSNTNEWIKTSDRRPTKADLPIWYYNENLPSRYPLALCEDIICTHWKPAKNDIPAPPKNEAEIHANEVAYFTIWSSENPKCLASPIEVWVAGREDLRAQIIGLIGKFEVRTLTEMAGIFRDRGLTNLVGVVNNIIELNRLISPTQNE